MDLCRKLDVYDEIVKIYMLIWVLPNSAQNDRPYLKVFFQCVPSHTEVVNKMVSYDAASCCISNDDTINGRY
jgi:GR25 family glycosyltransferase involved in LPS biosynthesis